MKVNDFDYALPNARIAQHPLTARDSSGLLVLNRKDKSIKERVFTQITDFISNGDCLILNNTKVIPARIFATKTSGAKIEFLLIRELPRGVWEVLAKPAKRLKQGTCVYFGEEEFNPPSRNSPPGRVGNSASARFPLRRSKGQESTGVSPWSFKGKILEKTSKGSWLLEFTPSNVRKLMSLYGSMPTPPYIKEELRNDDQYQTVYAEIEGAIAAPTAGFHFTPELLSKLSSKGVKIAYLTLHVGMGTFRPIKAENIDEHRMDEESYIISQETADVINETRTSGGRVFAVGTTVVRALESAAEKDGEVFCLNKQSGSANIFIRPGYRFKIVDCILTNFHLPRSTNLVLISSFGGLQFIRTAYSYALEKKFRFYSFGDAMLII